MVARLLMVMTVVALWLWGAAGISLRLETDKKSLYIGEALHASLFYRLDARYGGSSALEASFDPQWNSVMLGSRSHRDDQSGVTEGKIAFVLFPSRAGSLFLSAKVRARLVQKSAEEVGLGSKDTLAASAGAWTALSVETVPLQVRPIAPQSDFTGRARLSIRADRSDFLPSSPRVVTVMLEGSGDLHRLVAPPLEIPGVSVYAAQPLVRMQYAGREYTGSVQFRYTLIARKSYSVPPFLFRAFDPATGR